MADQFAGLLAQAEIRLDRAAGALRDQLYLQLRDAVPGGRLPPRAPLPCHARPRRRARHPASHDLSDAGYAGVAGLREQMLRHVRLARHGQAQPEQVIVLPSAQAAFDLVAQLVLDPGDTAWIEDPGYPGIHAVLRGHRARIQPVPVDAQGLRPEAGGQPPRLVCVTPSHPYPTGVTMSLPRRLELLALAHRAGAAIIEDDCDSEFQYRGPPTASLQGLDRRGCVHDVGTFSKSLAPGLHGPT